VSDSRLTYRFGPLERRGILGPVRAGQAALLAGAGLVAIAVIDRAPTATGAFFATAVFAGAVLLAVAPIGSRTAEEWAPVAASFALRRVRRRTRFCSPVPARGVRLRNPAPPGQAELDDAAPAPPASLAGVQILAATGDDHNALLMLTVQAGFGAAKVTLPGARLYLLDDNNKIKAEHVIFYAEQQ